MGKRTSTTTATDGVEAVPGPTLRGLVLVVFHERVLGGATISVLRCIPGLEERGWRFVFWAPSPSPLYDQLRERGLEVHGGSRPIAYSLRALRLPPGARARLAATPGYLRGFRRTVRERRPVLVHANSLTTVAEAAIARTAGVPVVFHLHEMIPASWKGRLAAAAIRSLSRQVIAVSEASAVPLGAVGDRLRIVHECTPIPESPRSAPPATGNRRTREALVIGSVGVISRRKGSDLFVEAARLVGERNDRIEFRLVGSPTEPLDGEWADGVLDRARQVGVVHQPKVDVQATLQEWDMFVLPSRRDPFPISMLEAMAAGLPVIGTAVDGIREQIAPGTGVLVEPEDPEALAAAVLRLAESPEERARIGEAARRRVSERFSLEHQVAGLDAAYLAALGREVGE